MDGRIRRDFNEPDRAYKSYEDRWKGVDQGLIVSWEIGRRIRIAEPDLASRACNGELPILGWKGGLEANKKYKLSTKYGTLHYLAQWQALRGESLDIDLFEEPQLRCSATGVLVTFTNDVSKYAPSEI